MAPILASNFAGRKQEVAWCFIFIYSFTFLRSVSETRSKGMFGSGRICHLSPDSTGLHMQLILLILSFLSLFLPSDLLFSSRFLASPPFVFSPFLMMLLTFVPSLSLPLSHYFFPSSLSLAPPSFPFSPSLTLPFTPIPFISSFPPSSPIPLCLYFQKLRLSLYSTLFYVK